MKADVESGVKAGMRADMRADMSPGAGRDTRAPVVDGASDEAPGGPGREPEGGRPAWLLAAGRAVSGTGRAGRYLGRTLRMMVGVPDYPTYVAHMRARHPDVAPMSYEEFFRDRINARYDARRRPGGCC